MQAPRNYGATRGAPGPSRLQIHGIPPVSLQEEQESGSVQNDDEYFGVETFQSPQSELVQGVKFSSSSQIYRSLPWAMLSLLQPAHP